MTPPLRRHYFLDSGETLCRQKGLDPAKSARGKEPCKRCFEPESHPWRREAMIRPST